MGQIGLRRHRKRRLHRLGRAFASQRPHRAHVGPGIIRPWRRRAVLWRRGQQLGVPELGMLGGGGSRRGLGVAPALIRMRTEDQAPRQFDRGLLRGGQRRLGSAPENLDQGAGALQFAGGRHAAQAQCAQPGGATGLAQQQGAGRVLLRGDAHIAQCEARQRRALHWGEFVDAFVEQVAQVQARCAGAGRARVGGDRQGQGLHRRQYAFQRVRHVKAVGNGKGQPGFSGNARAHGRACWGFHAADGLGFVRRRAGRGLIGGGGGRPFEEGLFGDRLRREVDDQRGGPVAGFLQPRRLARRYRQVAQFQPQGQHIGGPQHGLAGAGAVEEIAVGIWGQDRNVQPSGDHASSPANKETQELNPARPATCESNCQCRENYRCVALVVNNVPARGVSGRHGLGFAIWMWLKGVENERLHSGSSCVA